MNHDTCDVNYRFWDDNALLDGFDDKCEHSFFQSETYFIDKIFPEKLTSVLDVGCSCGRWIELLKSRGFSGVYHGIDISLPSIQRGRKNYPQCLFDHRNFLEMSCDSLYEFVNATGVVQHETAYLALIKKMVATSSHHVLFDLKLANIDTPLVDIEQCYCEVGAEKIHMVVLPMTYLIDLLSDIGIGKVAILGYETPVNRTTVRPKSINKWVSCGVYMDKSMPFSIDVVAMPEWIKQ